MRVLLTAALLAAVMFAAYAQQAEFLDPAAEYKLAYEAEQRGELEAALQHWENLIDSCDIEPAMRLHVVDRVRRLRPKVTVDPAKEPSNTWSCLVLVYKNLDFEWTDASGKKQHVTTTMSEQDVAAVREGMDNFARHVLELSSRELRLAYDLKVVDRTVTALVGETSFWFAPGEAAKDMEDVKNAAYDTVIAYTKFQQEEAKAGIPAAFGGGSLGSDAGAKGCGYINIILWPAWLKPGSRDGEIELHEWLHQVDWAFTAIQGYPDDICPTSDGGRVEGDFGGDPDFRRTPDVKNWMPFYAHIMRDHVTRRMWRTASMHKVPDTPWQKRFITEWLVLGPFEKKGGKTFATPFIDETDIEASLKLEMPGKVWTFVQSQGAVLDLNGLLDPNENVVAYAHVYVHSETAQRAKLLLGTDDGAVVWHNNTQIYRSDVPRPLTLDANSVDVMLTEGRNSFLFKVDEIGGGWALSARFVGPDGRPLKGVTYTAASVPGPWREALVQPGDTLDIQIGRDIHMTVRVDENGVLELEQIGKLEAAGKTEDELEVAIDRILPAAAIHVNARACVTILTLFYHVEGQVRMPGKKPYVRPITVYRAIVDAGGFTANADKRRVRLVRSLPYSPTRAYVVDCESIQKGAADSVQIYRDDIIHVLRKR